MSKRGRHERVERKAVEVHRRAGPGAPERELRERDPLIIDVAAKEPNHGLAQPHALACVVHK